MKFRDLIRKIFTEKTEAMQEEKISFKVLSQRIIAEREKLERQSEVTKQSINHIVVRFISDITQQMAILQEINLDKRKESTRLKIITLENLKTYIRHLEQLTQNLNLLEQLLPRDYIARIPEVFTQFNKASHNSFEKATILIGKELEIVQNIFINFNSAYKGSLSNTAAIFEKELNTLTLSAAYQALLEEKKQRETELALLSQEAQSLKEKCNLKILAKYYHIDPKKNKILSEYRGNFLKALSEDQDFILVEMMKTVNPESDISKNLEELKRKAIVLQNTHISSLEEQLQEKNITINDFAREYASLHNDVEQIKKKQVKIQEKALKLQQQIQNAAQNFSWNVIEFTDSL